VDARPPALLLGSDSLTGLQIARLLWRRRIPVIGLADRPGSPYCRSRAFSRTLGPGTLDDPVPALEALAADHGARPVLLACSDEHARWLNEHRNLLARHADFLLPDADTLDRLSDKARFYRYGLEQGLALPETRIVKTPEELERAARELGFPLVVKPPRRSAAWRAASGVSRALLVDHADALRRLVPRLQPSVGELVLQQWIPGPTSLGRELCVCLDGRGELLAGVVLRKLRQWATGTGTGSLAEQVDDDEVLATGLHILRSAGYVGAGQLELKRDERDGRLYVIEMNAGRAALNFPLCEASGVEMTLTWYCASAGLPLPERRRVSRPGARWICWKRDLPAAFAAWRRGGLTLRQWRASLRGPRWSADVAADDPVPLLADALEKARRGIARAARGPAGRR